MIEKYLLNGLCNGYQQNFALKTEFDDNNDDITEYLLTVNIAQSLIKWNENNGWKYSIYLEYPTDSFLKNAFVPYMFVGNNIFDQDLIHPSVSKNLNSNIDLREGKIDIGITLRDENYSNFLQTINGIEIKGINPSNELIVDDIKRLVLAMEMTDSDNTFVNSIKDCYCLHIKKLGGDIELATDNTLNNSKENSIERLKAYIKKEVVFTNTDFEVKTIPFRKTSVSDIPTWNDVILKNPDDLPPEYTADEVGKMTKIIYGVLIHIYRKTV